MIHYRADAVRGRGTVINVRTARLVVSNTEVAHHNRGGQLHCDQRPRDKVFHGQITGCSHLLHRHLNRSDDFRYREHVSTKAFLEISSIPNKWFLKGRRCCRRGLIKSQSYINTHFIIKKVPFYNLLTIWHRYKTYFLENKESNKKF